MTNEQIWQTVLGEVELTVSKANFTTWFKSTSIANQQNGVMVVNVPNGFTKEWLENKYNKFILKSLKNILPEIKEIKYIIGKITINQQIRPQIYSLEKIEENKSESYPEEIQKKDILQEKTQINLNPKYTFESFVIASSNELAQATCAAITKKIGKIYNPLFIYGGVGLGKTHLLQATGNEILKNYPNKKIKYTTSEKFTNELIQAIKNRRIAHFKNDHRKVDVLIIDDIQFLAGKEKTQEEFFHTFNTLHEANKQIIISSDRLPKAIPSLEERLISRFEGGMIADIGYPDFETRMAILKNKIKAMDFYIDDDALKYIATHIQKNVRELEGALNKLAATCQFQHQEPNLKTTEKILKDLISKSFKKSLTPRQIIKIVAEFYDITVESLKNKSRKKEIVRPRQISMYLMRKEIKSSYPDIGMHLGARDHTTAIHAFEKINKEIEDNKNLEQEINLIKEQLYI
jgi:chromosomal replication initiator protein